MTTTGNLMSDGDPISAPMCHATNQAGKRCGRHAIPGATVCRYHGGAAPQVQRKAALRLLELVDPAVGVLAREMVKADRSSDRQAAANSVLDRAGVPRRVGVTDTDAARALLIERLMEMRDGRGGEDASVLTITGSVMRDEDHG